MASYSPVFSQDFINWTGSGTPSLFDVPGGFTAVVREFDIFTQLGEVVAYLAKANGPGAEYVTFATLSAFAIYASAQWTGRVVVPGGGSIQLNTGALGDEDNAYVGGYLLRNTLT